MKEESLRKIKYCLRFLPDKVYLKLYYFLRFKKSCNLKNPQTFNEKLQWLKLNDHNPTYSTMVDKYEVKKYVGDIIGEEYIIPTLGVWDKFEDIDFDSLPNQFVLKCTHDSGGLVIVKDKAKFDKEAAREKINKCLKCNFYYIGREWPYKNVKPRIIAEEYLSCVDNSLGLIEYKMFCFNGEPRLVLVCKGNPHGVGRTNDFYDMDFNHIPVKVTYPNAEDKVPKPKEYDELVRISRELSKGIPFVRFDTYVSNGKIYFGEMTFYHDGGFCGFNPVTYDKEFGEMIQLPNKLNKKN